MKKFILSMYCMLAITCSNAQVQNFNWVRAVQGTSTSASVHARASAVDNAGNVYVAGSFYTQADFDPGPGIFILSATGREAFILKLDSSGNFIWAKKYAAAGGDVSAMALDVMDNIYLTGVYGQAADFDPGPGIFMLGSGSSYILKLNSSGNFVWAKNMGGSVNATKLDALGNIYSTGFFMGIADFDPGPGTYTLSSNLGINDIFVSKLDSAGNFLWAKQFAGNGNHRGMDLEPGGANDVYVTGYFSGTVDFDPGPGVFGISCPSTSNCAFVAKLNSAGNLIWARATQGSGPCEARSIDLDAAGNVYSGGMFNGVVDFDPGAGTFTMSAFGFTPPFIDQRTDIYFTKWNSSGNLIWAKQVGGTDQDDLWDLDVDSAGQVYSTGEYNDMGNFDFDPGPAVLNLPLADSFILKLDATGNLIWGKNLSGARERIIVADKVGNVYTSGFYYGTPDFNTEAGIFNLSAGPFQAAFIHKLSKSGSVPTGSTVSLSEANLSGGASIFPNPARDLLYVRLDNGEHADAKNLSIEVLDVLGEIVLILPIREELSLIDMKVLSAGLYFINIKREGTLIRSQKVIKE
ncbi:MAG TPA: T9SS type A sorting domain-containing protein [Bacteroidia bacterium]|nr:T9SS type A sorting domain-containing protein [Bacteroidia bacterium]